MSATARTAARPAPARPPAAPSAPAGHRLAVVPPPRSRAPRAPFVVLLGVLLTAGLAGLLYLHTALAQDSFLLHDLQNRSAALEGREQALAQQVSRAASPARLAARAEALGMVRSPNPAFIRLADGKVLGKPRPGVAPPPPPAPAPSATTDAAGDATRDAGAETDAPQDQDSSPSGRPTSRQRKPGSGR